MVTDTSTSSELTNEGSDMKPHGNTIRKWETRLTGMFYIGAFIIGVELLFPGTIYGAKIIAMTLCGGAAIIAQFIRPICPRCGKKFFKLGLARDGTWKNKCVHCGLPKGAPRDPDSTHLACSATYSEFQGHNTH